jgi:hypothetical protein
MEAFRKTLLAVIVGLIVILSIALYVISAHIDKYSISEGFVSFSVPRDIPIDYREDVEEFVNNYSNLAQKVCAIQNVVIDGIAKTLAGPQGTPDLAQAQVKAKAMANGQLFDCGRFQKQMSAFAKNDPTIKDFYNFFDDIPDNIGYRLWNSARFSRDQIADTYKKVNSSISAIRIEDFADMKGDSQPSRCKSQELCPEEMTREIVGRLNKLKTSLQQAVVGFSVPLTPEQAIKGTPQVLGVQKYIDEATDMKGKLDAIKTKAESGQLLPSSSEKQPPSE